MGEGQELRHERLILMQLLNLKRQYEGFHRTAPTSCGIVLITLFWNVSQGSRGSLRFCHCPRLVDQLENTH